MNRAKRLWALLTCLALLTTLTLPAAAEGAVFTINSPEDWAEFVRLSTRDVWSQGMTVELTTDLDLSDSGSTPVPIFQGTFHGNGHTISGVSYTEKGSKVGLFRTLTQSAVVEDLTVTGTLEPQGTASSVGLLAGENYGTIRRCTAQGTVSGQEDVGGLVGLNGEEGVLSACSSNAQVTGVTNAGGIAGQNLGTLDTCSNSGSINPQANQDIPTNVGGIAGLSRGTIRDCSNSGVVGYSHLGYNMGGIAGLQSGEVLRCSNTGRIQGRKDVGGIVGQFEPSTTLTYSDSPTQALSDSLGGLLDELSNLTNTLDAMAGRGIEDAQVIHDALTAIQDKTHATGSQGHADFQAMSDKLYDYTTSIHDNLTHLSNRLDQFNQDAEKELQTVLDQSDQLLDDLQTLFSQADAGIQDSISVMERTLSDIRAQLQIIRTHRQALEQELDQLNDYIAQVAALVAEGRYDEALQIPFPNLSLSEHLSAISAANQEIAQLATQLPKQWSEIYDRLSSSMKDTGKDMDKRLSKLYDALDTLLDLWSVLSKDVQNDLDAISQGSEQIRTLLKDYTDTLGNQVQDAADEIDAQLTVIQNQADQMTQWAKEDRQAIHSSSQAMLDRLEEVRQAVADLGKEPELTVTDLTDQVEEGPGLIAECTCTAQVSGDTNVGGIIGTAAPELGDDPEATFDFGDLELLSDVYATLRCVVRDCRFDGGVTVKNECGGGVAGRCEVGAILDCVARGSVEVTGDYCAGIAGRTRGKILRCAALVDLTGESWLGGIAGLGQDISGCRSMVQADSQGEYLGAIAGQAEGDLSDNFYLFEDLAGLDSVDRAGLAQGLDFDAFSQLSGIPEDFLTFSYQFKVDGKIVAEVPFAYGADLDLTKVPQAPERNGEFGQWPQFSTTNLRRSRVIEAQFASPTSTLADREGVAQLLVEGTFAPDASLTVTQAELPVRDTVDAQPVSAWNYTVTGSQSDTVTLRLRTDGAEHPAAALYQDGSWVRAESTLDGSYLVLEAPVQGQVVLLDEGGLSPLVFVLGGVGLAALLAAVWLIRRRRRSSSHTAEQATNS